MSSLTNFNLKKLFLKKLFWKCIKRALSTSLQLQLLILSNFWVLKAKSRELLSEEWLSLITWPQFNQWKSIHSQWRSFFCASFLQFWPPGYILTILIPNSYIQRRGYSNTLLDQFNVQQIVVPHIHCNKKLLAIYDITLNVM